MNHSNYFMDFMDPMESMRLIVLLEGVSGQLSLLISITFRILCFPFTFSQQDKIGLIMYIHLSTQIKM